MNDYQELTKSTKGKRHKRALSHLSLHAGADKRGRARGHVVEHHDATGRVFEGHNFEPNEGDQARLLEHLIHHGDINLPQDLHELIKGYAAEASEGEEAEQDPPSHVIIAVSGHNGG